MRTLLTAFPIIAMSGLAGIRRLGVLHNRDVRKACPIVGAGFFPTDIIGTTAGEQRPSAGTHGNPLICSAVLMIGST